MLCVRKEGRKKARARLNTASKSESQARFGGDARKVGLKMVLSGKWHTKLFVTPCFTTYRFSLAILSPQSGGG